MPTPRCGDDWGEEHILRYKITFSKYIASARENVVISSGCVKSPCTEDLRFLPMAEMTETPQIRQLEYKKTDYRPFQ
jgi:hypothetical protein